MAKPDRQSFCAAPWYVTRVRNVGAFGPCCHWQSLPQETHRDNLQKITIEQYRHSQIQRELRETMLSGQQPSRCSYCFAEEREKKISLRQKLNATYTDWDADYQADQPLPLKEVQIELGNLCNYKCVTCMPELSTQVASDWKKLQWLDSNSRPAYLISDFDEHQSGLHIDIYQDPAYLQSFKDSVSELDSLRILGGEPMVNPMIDSYMDMFDAEHAKNIQLLIATNCSVWKPQLLEKFTKFGKVKINLSIDATGALYDYIRHNGHWSEVKDNLIKFQEYGQSHGFIFTLVVTVSVYNMLRVPDIVSELSYLMPQTKIVLNPVYEPLFLDCAIAPREVIDICLDRQKTVDINPLYHHKIWLQMELKAHARRLGSAQHDAVKWQQFVAYTKELEHLRGNSIIDLVPELYKFIEQCL